MRFYRIFCQDLPPVTGHGCQKKWMKIYGETKYCGAMELSQNQSVFSPLEELNYESNTYVVPGI